MLPALGTACSGSLAQCLRTIPAPGDPSQGSNWALPSKPLELRVFHPHLPFFFRFNRNWLLLQLVLAEQPGLWCFPVAHLAVFRAALARLSKGESRRYHHVRELCACPGRFCAGAAPAAAAAHAHPSGLRWEAPRTDRGCLCTSLLLGIPGGWQEAWLHDN